MPLGRPIPPMTLDARMREQLTTMTRSMSLSQALAQRAKIILLAVAVCFSHPLTLPDSAW
jgi:hypothetical protein